MRAQRLGPVGESRWDLPAGTSTQTSTQENDMDPLATYHEIVRLAKAHATRYHPDTLQYALDDLSVWLTTGGYTPRTVSGPLPAIPIPEWASAEMVATIREINGYLAAAAQQALVAGSEG